ncbi:MAG TPA: F0F1 ATP synthase subunit B [Thermoleophilaceae bacterium]|nr:F0F1 ATP synthase subunit B [Thermoleophilaceae bacterium]
MNAPATFVLAATSSDSGGSFLVSPGVGLMIWTLIAFGVSLLILQRYAFPRIADALDKRRLMIDESIEHAERVRKEADELLEEYRARLREAREQAEDILVRSRKAAEAFEAEAREKAQKEHQEALERTRREIEAETRRALDEIRKEVADLTIIATEKVARKSLDGDDQKRLIEEALSEVDFSAFAPEGSASSN